MLRPHIDNFLDSYFSKFRFNKINFLIQTERETLTKILHHLREIERRRLFSQLGCRSLFDYAVKHLGYSEDQAYRRIQAMRAIQELPEVEEKLKSGTLSLTNLALAQKHFKQEKKLAVKNYSIVEKMELINKIIEKPTREAEKIVLSQSSSSGSLIPDKIKSVSEKEIEVRFIANEVLQKKIEKLKGLRAHSKPTISLGELFNELCDLAIEKWDIGRKTGAPQKPCSKISLVADDVKIQNLGIEQKLTIKIKREVWKRAQSKCELCHSQYALQMDHIQPKALGGKNNLENLRLLCRSCNQRATIKALGVEQMGRFLNS